VRRALIPKIWPLMPSVPPPAGFTRDDIRKFEARGTASAAPFLAIGAALDVVERIGLERKMARLVWLRERWLSRIADLPGVRLNTSRRPGLAGAIMNIDFEGLHPVALARWLWDNHRALVAGIENAEFRGIRVVPAIYTTEGELDRFADLLLHARKHGIG
jgi:selenocysteine lyase/cysteine desulfurase